MRIVPVVTHFSYKIFNESNDNDANPSYPSSYELPGIISVAATDQNDVLASAVHIYSLKVAPKPLSFSKFICAC